MMSRVLPLYRVAVLNLIVYWRQGDSFEVWGTGAIMHVDTNKSVHSLIENRRRVGETHRTHI